PTRFDAILDLVERAIAGRRDAEHVDPDIAAARHRHRIGLHADVGSEGALEHARALRQTGHRLTVGTAAGAVDRLDLTRVQLELLRDLVEPLARGTLVLDLVLKVEQVAL